MKKFNTLLLSCLLIITACSKDKDEVIDPDQVISDIETNIVVGEWMISSCIVSGLDTTANFDAYTFTFNTGGVVSASSDPEMLTGAWLMDKSIGSSSHAHFDLFFGVDETHPFDGLKRDWDVEEYTPDRISLEDKNDDDVIDRLVFTKK